VFEDIPKNEFWNIVVRRFSTPILCFRKLPIGVKTGEKSRDKSTPMRVESWHYPVEVDPNTFFRRVLDASDEECSSYHEAYDVVAPMLESCKAMRNYWNKCNEMKTQVEKISRIDTQAQRFVNILLANGKNSPDGKARFPDGSVFVGSRFFIGRRRRQYIAVTSMTCKPRKKTPSRYTLISGQTLSILTEKLEYSSSSYASKFHTTHFQL
jgi:hypothetical protein